MKKRPLTVGDIVYMKCTVKEERIMKAYRAELPQIKYLPVIVRALHDDYIYASMEGDRPRPTHRRNVLTQEQVLEMKERLIRDNRDDQR